LYFIDLFVGMLVMVFIAILLSVLSPFMVLKLEYNYFAALGHDAVCKPELWVRNCECWIGVLFAVFGEAAFELVGRFC